MQRSDVPRIALQKATQRFEALRSAETFPELEDAWKEFLHALDRVWNKAEAHFRRSPKWPGWAGKYYRARSKDDLLKYLIESRNVDEHSIEPITQIMGPKIGVGAVEGVASMTYRNVHIDRGHLTFEADAPVRITIEPPRARLLPVTNRGRTYFPPIRYLGGFNEEEIELLEAAETALEYYRTFLTAAEAKFYEAG